MATLGMKQCQRHSKEKEGFSHLWQEKNEIEISGTTFEGEHWVSLWICMAGSGRTPHGTRFCKQGSRVKVLVSASFFLVCSESVTWVTDQSLLAGIQARCDVTPGNGGILVAAKMVTCPPYVGIV